MADFGIARQLADTSGLTATNIAMGTVAYAAPEQLMGGVLDGRTDQYALAATAFHLLTGSQPFSGTNPVAVISQHLTAAAPKLSTRRPDLARLDQVLTTALAKEPGGRFRRCRDFADALQAHASGEVGPTLAAPVPGDATQVGYPRPAPTPHARATAPPSKLPWILVGAAVGTIAGLVILLITVVLDKPAPPANDAASVPTVRASAPTAPIVVPTHTSTTSVAPVSGPVLDGAYRVDLNFAERRVNGVPGPAANRTAWWAFRSTCAATGCVATATKMDANGNEAPTEPGSTGVFHFVGDHWEDTPETYPGHVGCPAGGSAAVTMVGHSAWYPQPDGSYRGAQVASVESPACGVQGEAFRVPFTATRIGDVPFGVTVADPVLVGG